MRYAYAALASSAYVLYTDSFAATSSCKSTPTPLHSTRSRRVCAPTRAYYTLPRYALDAKSTRSSRLPSPPVPAALLAWAARRSGDRPAPLPTPALTIALYLPPTSFILLAVRYSPVPS